MLFSLALIFLMGLALGGLLQKIKLPPLLGMLITGIVLGPYALNLIDANLLAVSADLRRIALIIILLRAGLSLDVSALRRVGRPAVLLCFVPACAEILGMAVLAPMLLGVSVSEALVMGAVVAAVSPAVVVPKMLKLQAEGYGTNRSIPQMIMAGASVDDVFVIVLFTAFTALAQGQRVSAGSLLQIPMAIVVGVSVGLFMGWALAAFFKKIHLRDSTKVLMMLSVAFVLVSLEDFLKNMIGFSGLLAVMAMGVALQTPPKTAEGKQSVAERLSIKFSKLWVGAEVLLFVLVGATVDIRYAAGAGFLAVILIFGALVFRMLGVALCLIKTPLSKKERLFCMIAYCPKATVQAAIGGLPLAMGLSCGNLVLTVAVLAILITAPLGAFAIDITYKKWLSK